MKIVGLSEDNEVVEIRAAVQKKPTVKLMEAPDDCEIGCQYIEGQWIPRPKNDLEKKIEALEKAVLTGDKSDLEAL